MAGLPSSVPGVPLCSGKAEWEPPLHLVFRGSLPLWAQDPRGCAVGTDEPAGTSCSGQGVPGAAPLPHAGLRSREGWGGVRSRGGGGAPGTFSHLPGKDGSEDNDVADGRGSRTPRGAWCGAQPGACGGVTVPAPAGRPAAASAGRSVPPGEHVRFGCAPRPPTARLWVWGQASSEGGAPGVGTEPVRWPHVPCRHQEIFWSLRFPVF